MISVELMVQSCPIEELGAPKSMDSEKQRLDHCRRPCFSVANCWIGFRSVLGALVTWCKLLRLYPLGVALYVRCLSGDEKGVSGTRSSRGGTLTF